MRLLFVGELMSLCECHFVCMCVSVCVCVCERVRARVQLCQRPGTHEALICFGFISFLLSTS